MADLDGRVRHLRCPKCGLALSVPAEEPLPDEGPTCAMGHEPVSMETAISEEANRG